MGRTRLKLSALGAEERARLAARLAEEKLTPGEEQNSIPRRKEKSSLAPLSFTQRRIWFLEQFHPGIATHHIPTCLHLSGPLVPESLQEALRLTAGRHEALRTGLRVETGEVSRVSPAAGAVDEVSLEARCLSLDGALQAVSEDVGPLLTLDDLEGLPASERDHRARELIDDEVGRPFQLEGKKLWRARLIRLSPREHYLALIFHHLVFDGWSFGVFFRDLSEFYSSLLAGRPPRLPDLSLSYSDYAAWQRERLEGMVLQRQMAYWKDRLVGSVALPLPTDYPRPPVPTYAGATLLFELPKDLTERLTRIGRAEGASLFMVLVAALKTLLMRYSGRRDIALGTPIANRHRSEVEGLIGFFANTLVLRTDLSGRPAFIELLRRVRDGAMGAYENQDMPFEKLVEELQPERKLSHHPIFQVMFSLQNTAATPLEMEGLSCRNILIDSRVSRLDLSLQILESAGHLKGVLTYSTDLFRPDTAERMAGHFRVLLEGIAADPRRRLEELPLLTPGEREALGEWNRTERDYGPETPLLHELVAARAARTPKAPAVKAGEVELSYGELDRRAAGLAALLGRLGVGADRVVALCLERSPEMVVGLLGVLKAGGAFLPLDPDHPAERLSFMVSDSGAAAVLTTRATAERLSSSGAVPAGTPVVLLDDPEGETVSGAASEAAAGVAPEATSGAAADLAPGAAPGAAAGVAPGPDNLAYVIYTSGSTGTPKAAMCTHRGIVNQIHWLQETYPLGPEDRVLQKTPYSFDVSLLEFFQTLSAGARLVMAEPGGHRDPGYLASVVREEGVTLLHFVPSMLRVFLEEPDLEAACRSVRRVICIGEALPPEVVRRFHERLGGAALHNLYGPAEASVTVSYWDCPKDPELRAVAIGRPVANTRLHVLDGRLEPAPVGVPGEIYIGGMAVGRGYLGRPDLTAERFVPDPTGGAPGGRLYRTGDLGRRRPDGDLEFLGRVDHQVKLRGFRVELGEIETALRRHPGVSDAVVVVREDTPGDQRLTAYFVPISPSEGTVAAAETGAGPGTGPEAGTASGARPGPVTATELRSFVTGCLPEYMVPSVWVSLETLPLGRSGKVDRRALPAPRETGLGSSGSRLAPRTPVEEAVAGIWGELLNRETVWVEDNFFDLGGHSLLATRMLSRVRRVFRVEIALRAFFAAPTVAGLAAKVDEERRAGRTGDEDLTRSPRAGDAAGESEAELSFAQERLWFIDRFEPDGAAYNITVPIGIRGALDVVALERSLEEIVRRHEVLRTRFPTGAGERPRQVVVPPGAFALDHLDLSALPETEGEEKLRAAVAEESGRPFDLAQGPVFRALLIRLGATEHVLILAMHHIVSDGWSMGVIGNELSALYAAFAAGRPSPLEEPAIQYRDFAHWQRRRLRGEVLEEQMSYWRETLGGRLPVLDLPTDRPRPAARTFRGAVQPFQLPPETVLRLRELSRRQGASLFMTLLAVFTALLHKYTGQTDIVVGTPIANRNRAETEELVGFFVNSLVLRTDLDGDPSFREIISRVQDVCLGAYDHQDLPFELLVEALQPVRDLSRSPLFQVMFVLQNVPGGLDLGGLEVFPVQMRTTTAKFDLTLIMAERGSHLVGAFEYNTDLFDSATVARMGRHFETLAEALVELPGGRLSEMSLLDDAEREEVLLRYRGAATGYPREKCLPELFEQQARATPEAVAVAVAGRSVTYAELDDMSARIAGRLAGLDVGPDVLVGLCLERSPEMAAGLLGILKAGGAYVPLDPDYPPERLALMLEDTRAPVILTTTGLRPHVEGLGEGTKIICLDDPEEAWGWGGDLTPPRPALSPENLAYVAYTSGSTGRPKGVAVPHRAVVRLVKEADYAVIDAGQVFLGLAPVSFDASTLEIWGPLLNGGCLALMPPGVPSLEEIAEFITGLGVTTAWLTVGLFNLIVDSHVDSLGGLRQLLFGGDKASVPHVRKALQALPNCRLINGYGPTENTTFTACARVDALSEEAYTVPIGRPIADTSVYILDQGMRPVPVGVPGELYTGGDGLARGYLGSPDATAEKFVPSPFPGLSGETGARLYRTGDKARWLAGGEIEFLGRLDHQVKIRGFRVEPGEIEAALRRHPVVRDAVVTVREDHPGDKRLAAYVVAGSLTAHDLRGFLEEALPEWMVPSAFVFMDALPLNPNGKVDRAALPAPELGPAGRETETITPRDELECRLVEIWEEVLDRRPIGIRDNFFELGGHSLAAVRMIDKVERATGGRLPVAAVFREPTVEHLADLLRHDGRERTYDPIARLRVSGSKRPIFCVPAAGGLVFYYADLVRRLGPDQPVYGLQARGLDGGEAPLESIEAMAEVYLAAVRSVQPGGRLNLVGYCMGGLIAFEMARRLRAEGDEPGLLALIDSSVPRADGTPPEDPGWAVFFWELVQRGIEPRSALRELAAMDPGPRLARLIERARSRNVLPPGFSDPESFSRWLDLYRANLRAFAAYRPQPYDGRLLLFSAAEKAEGLPVDLGWKAVAGSGLEVIVVPGDHFSMMTEPNVAALGEAVAAALGG